MKTEEEIVILTNNNKNKISLNQIISLNHNINDFKKINSSVNIINTSGSQPIVIFKKISKSLTQPFTINKKQKTTKAADNIIHNKKLNKYKSVISFPNQQQISNSNTHIIKTNKNTKNIKTLRALNKKVTDNKKSKDQTKSKEKLNTHIYKINNINNNKYINNRIKNKNRKEINQKEKNELKNNNINNKKESHSHGHFNRKEKITINNFVSKSTNEIKYLKHNINDNIPNYNINVQNNNKNIKFKIKKVNKTKANEESKIPEQAEQEHKKSEYMESLIKNGVLNVSKKFKIMKKPTKKEIITKKKKEFLLENGVTENNIIHNNTKNKIHNFHNINNLNDIRQIKKKNISKKNSYKKPKNLNISKSNSRFISLLNNNSNINITNINTNYINSTNTNLITTNINQETQHSNKISKKRAILKPQINQFEYINRIQQEQKKLITQYNKTTEKNFDTNECESKLSDSFRHDNKIQNLNLRIKNFEKAKKSFSIKQCPLEVGARLKCDHQNQNCLEQIENDEFPFSHRKSYRSPQEIMKYLKDKRIETKKEEENTEKEKQLKAYMTFKNLINIGKRSENNINVTKIEPKIIANKIRKMSNKEHLKVRKEPNEYYVGTESSKNNSTFIDKKEYYISILESKNFVNNLTKVSKHEEEKENEHINSGNKISIDIGENEKDKKYTNTKNKIVKKKLIRGHSIGFFENKKILDELYISINKANKIFSKENLKKFRNDLLKTSLEANKSHEEKKKISPLESKNNKKEIKNQEIINKNIDKTKRIKLEFANINNNSNNSFNSMFNNRNKIDQKLTKSTNIPNKLLSNSISFNNINSISFPEKLKTKFSHTYSNSLDKKKCLRKNFIQRPFIKLIHSIKSIYTKRFFTKLHKMHLVAKKNNNYLMALKCLIIIFKFNPYKTIEKYTKYLEYYEAFKELFKPFIRNKFLTFVMNIYELKLRKFILILEIFFKYKAMNKLFIYCERDFKKEIINFLILTIQKPFYDYFIQKLFISSTSIKNVHYSISKYSEENKEIEYDKKPTNEEVIYFEENNIFDCEKDYNEINNQSRNIHLIKQNKNNNNQSKEINTHLNLKELLNTNNTITNNNKNDLKKLSKVKDPESLAEEVSDLIIRQIVNSELKLFSPCQNIIPYKSFKYDLLPKSQNNSLNNSYISSSCASLEQIPFGNNCSYSNLNESILSQMSYYSEFNKTVRDKKKELNLNFYAKKIGPKLIELICQEIKNNYCKIIKNINTPLRTNFQEVVIALELKDNEQLKRNYRILNVQEELKDIISREKILTKFDKINKRIRLKYNQTNTNENFDIFMNLNIIDTSIELINKERLYGEVGEPFAYNSIRTRKLGYKYPENNSFKFIEHIRTNLFTYLNNPIFLIKDNTVNTDEKNIINYFKKDLEENEEQWEDMEIVETQSKLEVTELILDQLYNEIIEILEHVQLSRKRPDLYQSKSIYACEDIPKLSFQLTNENDIMQDNRGNN